MKKKPLVSIIIRTKNEERWIGFCLASVFDQEFKDFEVIVVDNDSSDKTLEKIKQYKVRLVRYSGKFMPGEAINIGIKNSSGKYIVCLSGHCVPVNRKWLSTLVSSIEAPEVAGVYGRQEPFSFSSDLDKRDLLITFGLDRRVQIKDTFFHNANSIFKRSIWEEVPFDELATNIEDRIWAKEVLERGYKIVYEPEASVYHHHGIHQNADQERCQKIVKILEKLEKDLSSREVDIRRLKIVGIIPVKGDVEYLGKKPLLEYTIKRALDSKYIKKVVVASDNQKVLKMAKKMGAHFSFLRPSELSQEHVEIGEVLNYVIEEMEKTKIIPDVVTYLSVNCPFRPKYLIDMAIAQLVRGGYDSILPTFPEYRSCWVEDGDKIKRLDRGFVPSKFKEPLYVGLSGLITVAHADVFRSGERLGRKIGMLKLEDLVCLIDIKKKGNFELANHLIGDWWRKNK